MNRRKICIISTSILFLLVLVNIPALNAVTYEREWDVGTVLEYTINLNQGRVLKQLMTHII